jgi:hypothetical protein
MLGDRTIFIIAAGVKLGRAGAICEIVYHQGHQGSRRKHLRPKAFVPLVLQEFVGCIVKLHHYQGCSAIEENQRNSARIFQELGKVSVRMAAKNPGLKSENKFADA